MNKYLKSFLQTVAAVVLLGLALAAFVGIIKVAVLNIAGTFAALGLLVFCCLWAECHHRNNEEAKKENK